MKNLNRNQFKENNFVSRIDNKVETANKFLISDKVLTKPSYLSVYESFIESLNNAQVCNSIGKQKHFYTILVSSLLHEVTKFRTQRILHRKCYFRFHIFQH